MPRRRSARTPLPDVFGPCTIISTAIYAALHRRSQLAIGSAGGEVFLEKESRPLFRNARAKSPEEESAIFDAHKKWVKEIGWGHGFGIMLARGLTDELFYNDAGNEVKLVKRFSAPQ